MSLSSMNQTSHPVKTIERQGCPRVTVPPFDARVVSSTAPCWWRTDAPGGVGVLGGPAGGELGGGGLLGGSSPPAGGTPVGVSVPACGSRRVGRRGLLANSISSPTGGAPHALGVPTPYPPNKSSNRRPRALAASRMRRGSRKKQNPPLHGPPPGSSLGFAGAGKTTQGVPSLGQYWNAVISPPSPASQAPPSYVTCESTTLPVSESTQKLREARQVPSGFSTTPEVQMASLSCERGVSSPSEC
jgi:hypothetical protein